MDNAHETIGTLRSDAHQYNLFHYFDSSNQLQLTIRKTRQHRVAPIDSEDIQTDFDVYDNKNTLVAKIEFHQDIMALAYQQFYIKPSDGNHVLIHSEPYLGHLGTKTSIYDNYLNMEVAQIIRPLFTLSLDSKVVITHQSPLLASINTNIFAATIALYSNKMSFYEGHPSSDAYISNKTRHALRLKVQNTAEYLNIDMDTTTSTDDNMQAASKLLVDSYQNRYADDYSWNKDSRVGREKKLIQLIDLGIDLVLSSNNSNPNQDKAMLHFMKTQLLDEPIKG